MKVKRYFIHIVLFTFILICLFLDYRLYYILNSQFDYYINLEHHFRMGFFGYVLESIDLLLAYSFVCSLCSIIILSKYVALVEIRLIFKLYFIFNILVIIMLYFLCKHYEPFNFGFG